jgi:hypothetical protein
MRRILPFFFLIEIVGMVVGLVLSLPNITYDNLCLVILAPRTLIIYAYAFSFHTSIHTDDHNASRAGAIIFQALLFAVTIYKFILAVRDGWGDVPLLVLLTRDGTWAFCLLFCTSSFCHDSTWVMLNLSCNRFHIHQSVMQDTLCCMDCKMMLMRVSCMGKLSSYWFRLVLLLIIFPDGF